MFDYVCVGCGYGFFIEEGYDPTTDTIKCPECGRHIKERE